MEGGGANFVEQINNFANCFKPSDKLTARRAQARKEQYKQVRAHVKKDDGRLQVFLFCPSVCLSVRL